MAFFRSWFQDMVYGVQVRTLNGSLKNIYSVVPNHSSDVLPVRLIYFCAPVTCIPICMVF